MLKNNYMNTKYYMPMKKQITHYPLNFYIFVMDYLLSNFHVFNSTIVD